MGNSPDFYEVLNLPKDSSSQEIRKAYKFLAKKWHPDKHPISSKAEAEDRFKAISQAYEALLNDWERRTTSRIHGINQTFSDQELMRKSPPIERKLECTLEELYWGCKKKVKFTRDVITKTGLVIQKPESHTIAVKSGWKKGTKIIFESMGESANFVFLISEKHHPLFKRVGNDLVLKLKVSLANALAGWSFSFVNLNGETISCSFHDEIISYGYEKVIRGKGMSIANQNGARGDLRIKFHVVFPRKLSGEQRNVVAELLGDGK